MEKLKTGNGVQKWLALTLNDPVIKILANNSNLTRIQLETILIDFLSEKIEGKPLNMEEKARSRLSKAGLSRGAFNRTLKQSRRNIIQSIYTVLLLGYLGIFETTRLDPYLEAANKLQEYVNAYRDVLTNKENVSEHVRVVNMLRKELEAMLEQSSRPRTMSEM